MSRELYLGVDGGGTKTAFLCIDRAGAIVAEATASTTYHFQVGLVRSIDVLRQGVSDICDQLSIATQDLTFSFFGLPAFGEDTVVDPQIEAACGALLGHDRYRCGNDMICGWAGSLACADGINLVAGTGSIGYGERHGRSARAGGWGEMFGDEGSAYWIAIQGLNAFTRMSDGRLSKGVLHRHFYNALGLKDDIDLCARVIGERGMSRDEIAGLARLVTAAAEEGDRSATTILHAAARELAEHAQALRRSLEFDPGERAALSWSGGVLTNNHIVAAKLKEYLDVYGGFELIEPRYPPAHGAALYAAHLAREPKASIGQGCIKG